MKPSNITVKRVSSGVWALEQEIVRCFLIVGQQRALLLDTGAEACDLMGMIREITPLPLVVLNTHGDGDHTANNNQFRDIHAHPDEFATIRRFRPDLTSTLHPITELSAFDLGDRVLHVIETPGHTPGSICLLDRKNRILFSGDTLSYGPVFLCGEHRDIHPVHSRRAGSRAHKAAALGFIRHKYHRQVGGNHHREKRHYLAQHIVAGFRALGAHVRVEYNYRREHSCHKQHRNQQHYPVLSVSVDEQL